MTVTRGVVQPQTNPVPLRICLGGEDSGGRLAVVEMALDPPSGPPLRLHPTHGERFDVLAGKLTLQLGEEIVTGGPGTWAFAAPDIPPERSAAEQETRVLGSPLTARADKAIGRSAPYGPGQGGRPMSNPNTGMWIRYTDLEKLYGYLPGMAQLGQHRGAEVPPRGIGGPRRARPGTGARGASRTRWRTGA
jgi:quercetin dioxygenase-like cupin family protein